MITANANIIGEQCTMNDEGVVAVFNRKQLNMLK